MGGRSGWRTDLETRAGPARTRSELPEPVHAIVRELAALAAVELNSQLAARQFTGRSPKATDSLARVRGPR